LLGRIHLKILEILHPLNIDFQLAPSVGKKPKMTDIEIIALSLIAESMSIDSEN